MYFSKDFLIELYSKMQTLYTGTDINAQGGTQYCSEIKYFLATDKFIKLDNKKIDYSNNEDKKKFCEYVGDVVLLGKKADSLFTKNFANSVERYSNSSDFHIGSNFFSTNVCSTARKAPMQEFTWPTRDATLLKIKYPNIEIHNEGYKNFYTNYMTSSFQKCAILALWLFRFESFSSKNSILNEIKKFLLSNYSSNLIDSIKLNESVCQDKIKDLLQNVSTSEIFPEIAEEDIVNNTKHITPPLLPRNRIIFGAPGTGKSHLLEQERSQHFDDAHYERVTFHPNYTYSQFVGAYKPVALENEGIAVLDSNTKYILSILQDKNKTAQEKYDLLFDKFRDGNLTRLPVLLGLYTDENFETKKLDGSPVANDNNIERNHGLAIRPFVKLYSEKSSTNDITYAFVPGPFARILAKAMQNPSENFLLVIEEINRANVAAVFGDVFQLLDRDESGKSEYPIDAGEDLKNYLEEQGISLSDGKIAIPANMYIWATMNSADQGVMPLDGAFKRRWEFEYIGIDENESEVASCEIPNVRNSDGNPATFTFIKWNDFRKALNKKLKNLQGTTVNEDKLLGPFFISAHCLENAQENPEDFVRLFKSKVLMYLYEDVCKMNPRALFKGIADSGKLHYSDVCAAFDKMGVAIFDANFMGQTNEQKEN